MAIGCNPALGMVFVQIVFAGVNILYKLAASDGMDLRVLVAYRLILGAAVLLPLSFLLERKKRPALTWTVLMQSFLCGLFGGTLTQNFYLVAIKLTTATFTTAIANLIPAITFLLAVIARTEKLGIRTKAGKAKLAGTALGLGGAMLLTFYKGPEMTVWRSSIDLLKGHGSPEPAQLESRNRIIGSLAAVASCFSYAIWMIIQTKMGENYPYVYSSTALTCMMGGLQSTLYAVFLQKGWSEWKLMSHIRLITVAYVGLLASGLTLALMAWCIQLKGALYASVFGPLMLVIVAVAGSLFLEEKLHLGSLFGAVLIVVGLYLVLWGKRREADRMAAELPVQKTRQPGEVEMATQSQSGDHKNLDSLEK